MFLTKRKIHAKAQRLYSYEQVGVTGRIKGWIQGKSMVVSNILTFTNPLIAFQSEYIIKFGIQIR